MCYLVSVERSDKEISGEVLLQVIGLNPRALHPLLYVSSQSFHVFDLNALVVLINKSLL